MKSTEKVIVVKDLVKDFGSFRANNHLTFEVYKGEVFGFLGANGAGKTTAIKVLCGLLKPTSGYVKVAGYDVYSQSNSIKAAIGYMSQKFTLYEDLTVYENITFYAGIYGLKFKEIKQKSLALIYKLGLEAHTHKLIKDLPLGWRQKLAFSIAIIHNPEIVFLDEPTSGVDPITRRQFWKMIYEAADRGITVFVTTHYMDEAEYCDRISVMSEGCIVALDTPYELKKKYGARSLNEVFLELVRTKQSI